MKNAKFRVLNFTFLFILFSVFALNGQDNAEVKKAHEEMKATFGIVPSFFKVFPDNALPGAWEAFKGLTGPNAAIQNKDQELIGLAVASQIPCNYCIYYHTALAKALGATDEEVKEAIAVGANVRHWSMVLQGNQIDLEEFKTEFDGMLEFMLKPKPKKE